MTVAPPAGTSSEAVLDRAIEAETILLADDNVEQVQTTIPGGTDSSFQTIVAAQSGRPANSATLFVRLAKGVDLTTYSVTLSESLAPVKTDGYDVAVAQTAGFSSNGLNVIVSGDDASQVAVANDAVLAALSDNTSLLNLKSDLSKGTPEIQVTPDPNKSIMVGLTAAQVAQEVRSALVGTVATRVVIDEAGTTTDLFVQLDPATIASVDDLRQAAGRHRRQGAAGRRGDRRAGRRAGVDHPHRRGPGGLDQRGDRRPRTPARSAPRSRPRSTGSSPPARSRRASRRGSPASRSSRPRPSRGCTSRWRSPSSWSTWRWCSPSTRS